MRYVAAYVLAVMGGNPSPTPDDIRAIISSVGIDIDESRLKKVMDELEGKDIEELMAQGSERLATTFVGGAVSAGEAPTEGAETEKAEEEKPTDKDDDDEGSDEDFGIGLFDM